MTTVTVPLNDKMLAAIEHLIANGTGANKADVIRKALQKYIEDKEVEEILAAMQEPGLEGDLDELASRFA